MGRVTIPDTFFCLANFTAKSNDSIIAGIFCSYDLLKPYFTLNFMGKILRYPFMQLSILSRILILISKLSSFRHFSTHFGSEIKKKLGNKKLICVSPDVGGVARTRDLANRIKADLAIIDKRRPAPGKSEVMNILGNVKNKTCVIVDDIIDSGGTIINAVNALIKSGANEVYVFISHGVLSGDAAKKIKNSKIKKLVVTDTIDNSKKINNNTKIEVLSISSLMSEAIKRIANSNSVSDLFN